jgi:hypothetical protein
MCIINASSLWNGSADRKTDNLVQEIAERINEVQVASFSVRHRIKVILFKSISIDLSLLISLFVEGSR